MLPCCYKHLCPLGQSMTEDLKRDIRDEVEFRQAQLNAQAQRLRGTVHMYLRDARMFVEQHDDTVARQMLVQKAMMEQRIAVMATHWSVLESVRASLQPSERRSMGDLATCRTILNKTGLEFIEPVVRREGDHEERSVDADAIDMELRDLHAEVFPPVNQGWVGLGGRGGGNEKETPADVATGDGAGAAEENGLDEGLNELLGVHANGLDDGGGGGDGDDGGGERAGVSEAEALLGPGAAGLPELGLDGPGGVALRKACAAANAAASAAANGGTAASAHALGETNQASEAEVAGALLDEAEEHNEEEEVALHGEGLGQARKGKKKKKKRAD